MRSGIISYQSGQIEDAERLIGLAVEANPSAHDAHYNRACLLQKMNRPAEALASFDQALSLKPDYLEALVNKASMLGALQRHDEALSALDKVIALNPNIPEIWANRASALIALKRARTGGGELRPRGRAPALLYRRVEEPRRGADDAAASAKSALSASRRSSRSTPTIPEALRNSADILLILKRNRDAADRYAKYLARKPDDSDAWANNGVALVETERYAEGLAAFDKAVALNPANADAWNHRGNVLFQLKRYDEAATSYERALSPRPRPALRRGLSGAVAAALLRLEPHRGGPRTDCRRLARGLSRDRSVRKPDRLAIARRSAPLRAHQQSPKPHKPNLPRLWQGERYAHDKIRVAYLSADFRPHPVAFLIAGVFDHHDKSRFETVGLSFGPASDSDIRKRMASAFDHFIDVRNDSDFDIASRMRRMEIDIAIDLTGFCEHGRTEILAFRPAPVQVNYLGFPGTTGADFVDYIIADSTIIPPEQAQFFSEKVVYLPDSYQANDRKRRIAPRVPTRREAGLPDDGTVFCAFNNAYKITPPIFDLWMGLLREVEGSVLWLLGDNPGAIRNLALEAEARGIARAPPDLCASGGPGRAPGAVRAGRPVSGHSPLQRAYDGIRRPVDRRPGRHLHGRGLREPGGGEPSQGRGASRAGHRNP